MMLQKLFYYSLVIRNVSYFLSLLKTVVLLNIIVKTVRKFIYVYILINVLILLNESIHLFRFLFSDKAKTFEQ